MKNLCLLSALAMGAMSSSAMPGDIETGMLFAGGGGGSQQLVCVATNNSTAPVTMTVRIIGIAGPPDGAATCTLAANDRGGCQAFLNNAGGHCRITVSGLTDAQVNARLRGVMFSRITTSPFTILGLVEAR